MLSIEKAYVRCIGLRTELGPFFAQTRTRCSAPPGRDYTYLGLAGMDCILATMHTHTLGVAAVDTPSLRPGCNRSDLNRTMQVTSRSSQRNFFVYRLLRQVGVWYLDLRYLRSIEVEEQDIYLVYMRTTLTPILDMPQEDTRWWECDRMGDRADRALCWVGDRGGGAFVAVLWDPPPEVGVPGNFAQGHQRPRRHADLADVLPVHQSPVPDIVELKVDER